MFCSIKDISSYYEFAIYTCYLPFMRNAKFGKLIYLQYYADDCSLPVVSSDKVMSMRVIMHQKHTNHQSHIVVVLVMDVVSSYYELDGKLCLVIFHEVLFFTNSEM